MDILIYAIPDDDHISDHLPGNRDRQADVAVKTRGTPLHHFLAEERMIRCAQSARLPLNRLTLLQRLQLATDFSPAWVAAMIRGFASRRRSVRLGCRNDPRSAKWMRIGLACLGGELALRLFVLRFGVTTFCCSRRSPFLPLRTERKEGRLRRGSGGDVVRRPVQAPMRENCGKLAPLARTFGFPGFRPPLCGG